jgi:polyhydroxyalkanoate synthesis regulator phasin
MGMSNRTALSVTIAAILACAAHNTAFAQTSETQSLQELRNTVINLLDGLVKRGVITREQAEQMVADAQTKAVADAKAKADVDAAEKDAIRVTHVPQIVRDEISKQVRAELTPEVTKEVIAQAKEQKWGVPGALPDWVSSIQLFGDLRLREERYDQEMPTLPSNCLALGADFCLPDFQAINEAGGTSVNDQSIYRNITTERVRTRVRLRAGLRAQVSDGVTAVVRLATGNTGDPVSTNQTLGQYGSNFDIALDQAYLRFDAGAHSELPWMTVYGGRNPNPFVSTDLVWDADLNFDGVAGTWRLGFGGASDTPSFGFLTVGAFPLQEIELSTDDKWLYAGQLGLDWSWADRARFKIAAAYYYFDNITGISNPVLGSNVLDYTAPKFMQKGNTLFDIRNDLNPNTYLFALASEYHLASGTAMLEVPMGSYKLLVTGDYVRNLGYDENKVLAIPLELRTTDGEERTTGYQGEIGFGTARTGGRGDWRAYVAYKHLERDAVVDAFTDSDFNLGGTDAKGYVLRADWWFRNRTALSLRYISTESIDSVPVNVDTAMLDINGSF